MNKAATIERCLGRVKEEYAVYKTDTDRSYRVQDALIRNLLRACEAAIDMAMHAVRVKRLGAPQSSRDAFNLLVQAGYLDTKIAESLKRVVGFRNIAIHNYIELSFAIIESIVTHRLEDLKQFSQTLVKMAGAEGSFPI